MKKTKLKPKNLNSILEAQERNRIAQEKKIHAAVMRNVGARLLLWLSPFLMATHFGARGGGNALGERDYFPPLPFTPRQQAYILKHSEKVIDLLPPAMRATGIYVDGTNRNSDKNVEWVQKMIPILNANCITFLPEWSGVDENNIMVNLLATCFLDWCRMQEHDGIELSDEILDFMDAVTTFADHLINANNRRLREALTVLYWCNWIRIFENMDPEKYHPNTFLGLVVPFLGEGEAVNEKTGEKKYGWFLEFKNSKTTFEIQFFDIQKKNLLRMEEEVKGMDAYMKERFPNTVLRMKTARSLYGSFNCSPMQNLRKTIYQEKTLTPNVLLSGMQRYSLSKNCGMPCLSQKV